MRKLIVAGLALAFLTVLIPAGNANHITSSGSFTYVVSAGVRVNHGITGVIPQDRNGIAATSCNAVTQALGGCIGGGFIFPSDYDPAAPINFMRMAMTVSDTVSGPNVYASICNYFSDGDTFCDDGFLDGHPDARVIACGATLVADATGLADANGVPHPGNDNAVAFTHNLWVDPYTTEVCVGTTGSLAVLFDKSVDA